MRNLILLVLLFSSTLTAGALSACSGDTAGTGTLTGPEAGTNLVLSGDDATTGDDGSPTQSWPEVDASFPMPVGPTFDASPTLAFDSGATPLPEAGPVVDASCTQPLAQGVLVIDELMIESVAGTGDYGEWLEVQNAATCAVDINGLHAETAAGEKLHTFDQTEDLWIPGGGTFLLADVADPAVNHYLPGPLVTWAGQPGDVLRNQGATVTLSYQGNLVDAVTYPSMKLHIGESLAFPADCPLSRRSDWTAWQWSTASWFPGFLGTPNAPNVDVACP
jgi:hypothetical protein